MNEPIPVTILSGGLGAGKTTLLNHLLRHAGGREIAVLVNDMGDVNIDADLVAEGSELDVDDGVAELSNGCICCELQDDLETAVVRLARERDFDRLVVESSGISEPAPVARLFTTESRVAALYDVAALVTVVDTRQFLDAFSGADVPERVGTDDAERPLSDLTVEQIEVSNVVLLNKADLCSEAELAEAEALVAALQPDAEVVRTSFSEVDAGWLLDADPFEPDAVGDLPGWKRALAAAEDDGKRSHGHDHASGDDGHDHTSEDDSHDKASEDDGHDHASEDDGHDHASEDDGHDHASEDNDHGHRSHRHPDEVYGVTSVTYRRRRPFHPNRIADVFRDLPDDVVRAKGTLWVAGNDHRQVVSQAGPSVRVRAPGPWIASLPEIDQDLYRSNRPDLDWHEEHGDHRTEFVVIGTGFDRDALMDALDDCLLTDAELEALEAGEFAGALVGEDPFPVEPGADVVLREP